MEPAFARARGDNPVGGRHPPGAAAARGARAGMAAQDLEFRASSIALGRAGLEGFWGDASRRDSVMQLPERSGRAVLPAFLHSLPEVETLEAAQRPAAACWRLQEMFREINTIGSKASDSEISARVVDIKCAVERMRELVQNIE